jgi:hypothetical protein
MSAVVDGKTVNVGDVVCFKSDYEQCGKIIAIKSGNGFGGKVLVLENENGFGGEYLRYATQTQELASDCWIED